MILPDIEVPLVTLHHNLETMTEAVNFIKHKTVNSVHVSLICIQSVLRASMEPSVTECASVRMVPNVTTSAELVPVPPAGWDHTVKRVSKSNKQMHSNSERFTFTYHKYHVYVISIVVSTTFLSVHIILYFPGHLSFSTVKCVFIPLMHWGLFFTRETGSLNQSWRATHPSCNLSVCKTECF